MVTSFPLDHILHNHEATGHIVEWALDLEEFNLHFVCTCAIKSRALADFLVESMPMLIPGTQISGTR